MIKKLIITVFIVVFGICGCTNSTKDESSMRYEEAIQSLMKADTEQERFYALNDAAKESYIFGKYEEAKNYADELLFLSKNYRSDWNYGNAIQDYHIVAGKISLMNGNITSSKKHLLAAGMSPGSPQMDSFGPNMSLAKELLNYGETEVVLEYFELCRSFWTLDYGKIDEWTQTVKMGDLPNFGSNLLY